MNPAPTQSSVQVPQVQATPVTTAPVVPISNQPLTLDPNMMTPQSLIQVTPASSATPPAAAPAKLPPHPVSGPHKEIAPLRQTAPLSEYVKPTEVTPQVPQEVVEAGVEVVHNVEEPQITPEHKAIGLQPAREAVPAVVAPTQTIQLPYSQAQAKQIEKEAPLTESRHWLATLTEYLLKKLQLIPA